MIVPRFTIGPSEEAKLIRTEVFCLEQGFEEEFDDLDASSISLVLFLDGTPIATGRLTKVDPGTYQIGRVAVRKEYRGKKVGSYLMAFLCEKAQELGAHTALVHSQLDKREFYHKVGFYEFDGGTIDYEQGVPHIFLAKDIRNVNPYRKRR